MNEIQEIKRVILSGFPQFGGDSVNEILRDNALEVTSCGILHGNDFIKSVCQNIQKYRKASEKQAYCVARFFVENSDIKEIKETKDYLLSE